MNKNTKLLLIWLSALAVLSVVASNGLSYYVQREQSGLYEFKKEAMDFDAIAKRWRDKEGSKRVIDEIADAAGKELFSTSITKREKTADSYLLSMMVLNGDELDSIISKVLNRPVAIKRIDVVNNDIGYLVTVEVYL